MIQVKWNNGVWKIFDAEGYYDLGWRNHLRECEEVLKKDNKEYKVITHK